MLSSLKLLLKSALFSAGRSKHFHTRRVSSALMVATDDFCGLRLICRIRPSCPVISPTLHMVEHFHTARWFLGLPWAEMISLFSLFQARADTCDRVRKLKRPKGHVDLNDFSCYTCASIYRSLAYNGAVCM